MTKVKLLIVDDNYEFCEILKGFFELCDEISLCGTAFDGEQAMTMISAYQPDVVLLDIIMPKLDGISVLEQMQALSLSKRPCVIVESAISMESVTNRALALGASYYVIKPYYLDDLLQRVLLLACSAEGAPPVTEHDTQSQIIDTVMELGIPTNVLGYTYIIDAVEYLVDAERPCSLTKQVYPAVAKSYNTTANCVESAVRKTIERLYSKKCGSLSGLMGDSIEDRRPSNGYFLTMLAEKVKEKLST